MQRIKNRWMLISLLAFCCVAFVFAIVLVKHVKMKEKPENNEDFFGQNSISELMVDESFLALDQESRVETVTKFLNYLAENEIAIDDNKHTVLKNTVTYDKTSGVVFYYDSMGGLRGVSLSTTDLSTYNATSEIENLEDDIETISTKNVSEDTDNISILMLYGGEHDDIYNSYIDYVKQYTEADGYSVQIDDVVTVEDYSEKMDDADIVIIISHGIFGCHIDKKFLWSTYKQTVIAPLIMTNEVVTDEKNRKYKDDINKAKITRIYEQGKQDEYYAILPDFFPYHYNSSALAGEYVHMSCCMGFGTDSIDNTGIKPSYSDKLANSFIECGAELVTGYYNKVSKAYDFYLFSSMLKHLASDKVNILEAKQMAEEERGATEKEFAEKIGWLDDNYSKVEEVRDKFDKDGAAHLEMLGNENYTINHSISNGAFDFSNEETLILWNDFLEQEKYLDEIDFSNTDKFQDVIRDMDNAEFEYVIYDLNNDGVSDLLIQLLDGDEYNREFRYTWVFEIVNGTIKLIEEVYGWGAFEYSPSKNLVLESPEYRPFKDAAYYPFCKLTDVALEFVYMIGQDFGEGYYYDTVSGKIPVAETNKYFDDIISFDWIKIPRKEDESEKKEENDIEMVDFGEIEEEEEPKEITQEVLCNSLWLFDEQVPDLFIFRDNGFVEIYDVIAIMENATKGTSYDELWGRYKYTYDGMNLTIYDFSLKGEGNSVLSLCNSSINKEEASWCTQNKDNLWFFYDMSWEWDDNDPEWVPIRLEKVSLSYFDSRYYDGQVLVDWLKREVLQ